MYRKQHYENNLIVLEARQNVREFILISSSKRGKNKHC